MPPALEGEILTTGSPEKSSRVYQLLKRLAFPVLKVQSSGKDIHHVRYQDTAFINHSFVFSRESKEMPPEAPQIILEMREEVKWEHPGSIFHQKGQSLLRPSFIVLKECGPSEDRLFWISRRSGHMFFIYVKASDF